MKKQTMSLAVASALLVGGSGAFGNMHVNDRGLGEVLIYPFYSAANANDTYIHVVNTTGLVKAVKVRFIEAQNSQEVLDFNLYLSPEDEWAGAITVTEDGGALIRTADSSCTVPELGTENPPFNGTQTELDDGRILRDQPFVNFLYDVTGEDDRTIGRTLEGYVEIIEMGQLVSSEPTEWPLDGEELEEWLEDDLSDKGWAATHNSAGVPNGCAKLVKAWEATPTGSCVGVWCDNPEDELVEDTATWAGGGLYGYGVLINVEDGTSAGYDATAIDAFADDFQLPGALHQEPGNVQPSLADATDEITIFNEGDAVNYTLDDGLDAVSAILMATSISNDYVADEGRNAKTDWILTMPTKRQYVNVEDPDEDPAEPPFTDVWDGKTACEEVSIEFWDREEAFEDVPSDVGFSPRPPQVEIPATSLCTEVSVLGFGSESAVKAGAAIYSGIGDSISGAGFSEGWARVGFDTEGHELQAESGDIFLGLPVIGFAVQTVRNENANPAADSVIANYAASVEHKSVLEVDPD